ncbi:MAG: nucleoside deaminase [Clostridia bacterium]|nr:nucleoside deaminase [Clostridia bacterium]
MDYKFMKAALSAAKKAEILGEIPVGAVVVKNGEIISEGYNLRETNKNALHHAEVIAIDNACKKLNTRRLKECDIYVTLEPCIMCGGAIINSEIKNVYFGAYDINGGSCGISRNIFKDFKNINVMGGIMEKECSEILTAFFEKMRKDD